MAIDFNHTIIAARDSRLSAIFLAEMLGLPAPKHGARSKWSRPTMAPTWTYLTRKARFAPQHYAFLVGESEFDEVFGRIRQRSLSYWADPAQKKPGQINDHDNGRGVYFEDPNGHLLEIITKPYGSGGWNP